MRLVFWMVLALGLCLAGFAVVLVNNYMSAQRQAFAQELQARGDTIPVTPVMVAVRSLRYGEELRPEDVAQVDWPRAALPPGVFASAEQIFPKNGEKRYVQRAMERGEPLLTVKVTRPGEDAGIRSRLEKGMRAFAINVDVQTGVSGFLRPGDRVDVYWTGALPTSNGRRGKNVTKLIDRSLRLIAVDQTSDGDVTGANVARTITVEITPQQVAALAQAQTSGRLSLALVGSEDDTIAMAEEVDQRSLLGIQSTTIEKRTPERVCIVKTRRGAEVVDIPIPCTN